MGDGDTAVAKVMEVDGSSIKYMNPMVKMRGDSDNEVDLNSPKLGQKSQFRQRISCCNLFGVRGLVHLFLVVLVALLHFALFYAYSHNGFRPFARMNREFLWVFLLFFCLFSAIFVRAVAPCFWKKAAMDFFSLHHHVGRRKTFEAQSNVLRVAYKKYKELFSINGKYYLSRLYMYEFMENYVSVYNLRTIYLCTMPHWACVIILGVLTVESSYRAFSTAGFAWNDEPVTKTKRDLQIAIDIFVDIIFLFFPFATVFHHGIPLTLQECVFIVLFPSISLASKLRKMIKEAISDNAEGIAVRMEKMISKSQRRQRESLFGKSRVQLLEALQDAHFPRWAKFGVFLLSAVYAGVLAAILIVQLARVSQVENACECYVNPACEGGAVQDLQNASNATHTAAGMFSVGCRVKTPFCDNLLAPSCDCAMFEAKGHGLRYLSDKFVEMSALRKVVLQSGPLEELPGGMEKLNQMAYFDVSFNRLQRFGVNVKHWGTLIDLRIPYNNVTGVHSELWKHKTIVNLRVNSNVGLSLPSVQGHLFMPSLFFLDIANNSQALPLVFGPNELPQVGSLDISGNKLRGGILPKQFDKFSESIQSLSIARLGLSSLPEYITTFSDMVYMDARNNSIFNISRSLRGYFEEHSNFELYFSGNPGCTRASVFLPSCTALCSDFCYSNSFLGDGQCDAVCNSQHCDLDGRDCLDRKTVF
jgi:hypothetical protein